MSIPAVGQDGIHHVLGKVVVARGLQLEILLETLEPVLKLRSDMLTFLVCPTIRHVEACCTAHDSLSAEERRAEGERQLRELGSLRREVKTWLIKRGYSNTLMVDPLQASAAAANIDRAREIMRDAVHMQPAGYSRLSDKIKELAKGWPRAGSLTGRELVRWELPQTARESGLTGSRSSAAMVGEAAAEGAAPEWWPPAGERGVLSPVPLLDRPVEHTAKRYAHSWRTETSS